MLQTALWKAPRPRSSTWVGRIATPPPKYQITCLQQCITPYCFVPQSPQRIVPTLLLEHSSVETCVQHSINLLGTVNRRRKEKSDVKLSTGFSISSAGADRHKPPKKPRAFLKWNPLFFKLLRKPDPESNHCHTYPLGSSSPLNAATAGPTWACLSAPLADSNLQAASVHWAKLCWRSWDTEMCKVRPLLLRNHSQVGRPICK